MEKKLQGKKIAILTHHGFEQSELLEPRKALQEAGAEVFVVSPVEGKVVKGWDHDKWGEEVDIDIPLSAARPETFDGLVLPGGVMNPDHLRMDPDAVTFVKGFFDEKKIVGAICHGPWTLIEAGATRGRRMTSWPSIQSDLTNAGATWINAEVVRDRGLVTSRKPADLPAFNAALIEAFAEAR